MPASTITSSSRPIRARSTPRSSRAGRASARRARRNRTPERIRRSGGAARGAVGGAPAAVARRRWRVLSPPWPHAAPIDELRVAEHPAFLVELAQAPRIDLDEHAFGLHDLRIELDRHASLAHDEAGGGADVAPPRGDDVVDDRAARHPLPSFSAASSSSISKGLRKVFTTPSSRATAK